MPKSRLFAVLSLFVLSAVLVACGSEDDAEPTAEPTATRSPVTATQVPGTPVEASVAPTAARVVAPADTDATPVDSTGSVVPVTDASATPVAASPVAAVTLVPTEATVSLEGVEQLDYVITEEGCMGIAEWRVLQPGTQVVVRDASGTVVDIGELESSDSGDGCSWVANVDVPDSGFFSISIPMVTDRWFDAADVDEIDLTIPAN